MKEREKIIRLWFDMWLQKKDLGLADIFTEDAVYIESWGPEYHGSAKIKLWFDECPGDRARLDHSAVFPPRRADSGGVVFQEPDARWDCGRI